MVLASTPLLTVFSLGVQNSSTYSESLGMLTRP
jgi:hypothetical protein